MRTTLALCLALLCLAGPASAEVLYRSSTTDLPNADARVSLDAESTPLGAAFSLLAMQVGLNVVVSPGVDGEITIHLNDVSFRQALSALTEGRDVSYFTAGDVIVVAPRTEGSRVGMGTLAFRLRHLRPESILEATRALMSADGRAVPLIGTGELTGSEASITTSTSTPTVGKQGQEGAQPVLIFRDYPDVLMELERALSALDVPQQQVEIEVQFVEARTNDMRQLGVEWTTQIEAGVGGADLGTGSTDETEVDTRSFSYLNDLNSGAYTWGTLGVSQVRAVLHYLVENNKGKIMSQPKVSVMDNETAEIRVTTTNPVQTVNRFSEGAVIQDIVTYQYIETGIKLLVRPRVSEDGYVSLSVNPVFEEILALVGPPESPAPVTAKREVNTTVKVPNGQTLILGGLTRDRDIETVSKVWLLGDLPLIGAFFRHTRTEKEQTELMIMITPRVIPQS